MKNFNVLISSPFDREKLVAEIYYDDVMIAELNQESENLVIEFYLQEVIEFNYNDFVSILEEAKNKLIK
jgi:hypothetical protein